MSTDKEQDDVHPTVSGMGKIIELGWYTGETEKQDVLMEENPSSSQAPGSAMIKEPSDDFKNVLFRYLDNLETRVGNIRANAANIVSEQEDVLNGIERILDSDALGSLNNSDVDEISAYIKEIVDGCLVVNVELKVERSPTQLNSLREVNNMIDSVIRCMHHDVLEGRNKCLSFLNSCYSDPVDMRYNAIDAAFENALLGCTAEDQKVIKKRISGLYKYFNSRVSTIINEL